MVIWKQNKFLSFVFFKYKTSKVKKTIRKTVEYEQKVREGFAAE